jgi:hypothetical protein
MRLVVLLVALLIAGCTGDPLKSDSADKTANALLGLARFEIFLGGKWYTFDARHNHPRIGRILIARGRDAADVAISTTFGPAQLANFSVVSEELCEGRDTATAAPLSPEQHKLEASALRQFA